MLRTEQKNLFYARRLMPNSWDFSFFCPLTSGPYNLKPDTRHLKRLRRNL